MSLDEIHENWRGVFCSPKQWMQWQRDEQIPRSMKSGVMQFQKELKRIKKFEKMLESICLEFKADKLAAFVSDAIDSPEFIDFCGELPEKVAIRILELRSALDIWRKSIEDQLDFAEAVQIHQSQQGWRTGPDQAVPTFVAERLLAGLQTHQEFENGTERLRLYFAQHGEFQNWFRATFHDWRHPILEFLCDSRGDGRSNAEHVLWARHLRFALNRQLKGISESAERIEKMKRTIKRG